MNEELIEAIFGMTAEAYNARCELQREMAEEDPEGWVNK
mgnify:CR=1 FL=1